MTTTTKSLLALAVVGALFGTVAFFGYSPFVKTVTQFIGSPVGSTFSTAKVAEVTMAPITSDASSTSLLNTDSSDRIVDSGFVSCATSSNSVQTGVSGGVATWNWRFATTTTSANGLQGNVNYAINLTVPTSTTDNEYAATSTNPAALRNRLWPTGTYLTFNANATTSNQTISCQAGVYYHGS